MKKYMIVYKKEIEDKLEKNEVSKKDIQILREKINDFQHERLIHLLVTLSFAFFTIVFLVLGMISILFLIPFFSLLIFLLFYIIHYFFLENNVQYLYKVYDKIIKKEE